jgi:uncharacterized protein
MSADFDTCMEEGLALFNAGHYYEAHEVWEVAWQREQGVRRQLLQALILLAAGWLKREQGNARGAHTLFTRALARLQGLPAVCEGMEVEQLVPRVERWREGEPHPELRRHRP